MTEICSEIEMYYDTYEYTNGDGLGALSFKGETYSGIFPQLEKADFDGEVTISFCYIKDDEGIKLWIQNGGLLIVNLDGDCGNKLLKLLNEKHNVSATHIYNGTLKQIHPKKR
jgi:hypothetical protein